MEVSSPRLIVEMGCFVVSGCLQSKKMIHGDVHHKKQPLRIKDRSCSNNGAKNKIARKQRGPIVDCQERRCCRARRRLNFMKPEAN